MRSIRKPCGKPSSIVMMIAAVAVAGMFQPPLHADSKKEVKVTARTSGKTAGGVEVVTLTLDVNKGWYIYANPVGNKEFSINETKVAVKGLPPTQIKIRFPRGKVKRDAKYGSYNIYDGKVNILVQIQHRPSDRGPINVQVEFQACHISERCLAPAKVAFKLR